MEGESIMSTKIQNDWLVSTYRPKDCDLSVTELCMPDAQLWARLHTEYKEDKDTKKVGLKSFIGSAVHKAIEEIDEDGVVKELSWVRTTAGGIRIGGTADELRWRYSINKWRLGDVKVKGLYPAKKFLGIGTKANPNPKPEQDKEILQMSIYRWLFEGMFDIEDKAVIYLFVPGHNSYDPIPDYSEVWLDLKPIKEVDKYIKDKIKKGQADKQPEKDCPDWLCKFCPYQEACTYYEVPEEELHEFDNEGEK